MVVYSSVNVPGTEFIALNGSLPSCLNGSEPHVIGSITAATIMRPAVSIKEGKFKTVLGKLILNLINSNNPPSDGFPLVCGGASVEAAVGCYSFNPGEQGLPGKWTETANHNSSNMP